jgi:hypothetical protein
MNARPQNECKAAAGAYTRCHYSALRRNEERVFFPWLASRVTMPERFSADHETLLKQMGACDAAITALKVPHRAHSKCSETSAPPSPQPQPRQGI